MRLTRETLGQAKILLVLVLRSLMQRMSSHTVARRRKYIRQRCFLLSNRHIFGCVKWAPGHIPKKMRQLQTRPVVQLKVSFLLDLTRVLPCSCRSAAPPRKYKRAQHLQLSQSKFGTACSSSSSQITFPFSPAVASRWWRWCLRRRSDGLCFHSRNGGNVGRAPP